MSILARKSISVQAFRLFSPIVAIMASAAALTGASSEARAGYDVSGNSSGVAVLSNLTVLNLANANVSVNAVSGTAPSTYSMTSTNNAGATIAAGGFNLPIVGTALTLLSGTTGVLNSSASSTIDGVATSATTSGSTTVNNLGLSVLGTLVQIGATTLTSTSTVSGTYNGLSPVGATSITGLSIHVLGVDVTALVQGSAGAMVNITGVPGLGTGLSIGINVKTITGDGISTSGITTDNIVVQLNAVSVLGLSLGGSLEIGESHAFTQAVPGTAVPEPSTAIMMGLGMLLTGAYRFRRFGRKPLQRLA